MGERSDGAGEPIQRKDGEKLTLWSFSVYCYEDNLAHQGYGDNAASRLAGRSALSKYQKGEAARCCGP